MRIPRLLYLISFSFAIYTPLSNFAPAMAQDPAHREERIAFQRGATSAVRTGTIRGRQFVDYLLTVRAGQLLNISLATRHRATYFNLLEPGQPDAAIFVGSAGGNQFEGVAARTGTYRIRIYMMRSAARRNEVANYRLETIVSSAAHLPRHPEHDALVPGTHFHATGSVECTFGTGTAQRCPFGVRREGPGKAQVTVTRPNGAKRVIFFEGGRATGYDRNHADDGGPFSVSRSGDISVVRIGSETYMIVDAIIDGG